MSELGYGANLEEGAGLHNQNRGVLVRIVGAVPLVLKHHPNRLKAYQFDFQIDSLCSEGRICRPTRFVGRAI